jgi:predicted nucleotidyltransferase
MTFTETQQQIFDTVLDALKSVPGIRAVALGGSFATGLSTPISDIDLALYYDESAPFRIQDVQKVIDQLNDTRDVTATDFYGWGRWVNGGAWLKVRGQQVDFLYRNLQQVERVIEACQRGDIETDYEQQAAHGFFSYIYLAETEKGVPVYDPEAALERLKAKLTGYPPALKQAILKRFGFHAQFTFTQYEKAVKRGDVFMATGCAARISSALVQCVYALNETYYLTDKGALKQIEGFTLVPARFCERLETVLRNPTDSLDLLSHLITETVGFA